MYAQAWENTGVPGRNNNTFVLKGLFRKPCSKVFSIWK